MAGASDHKGLRGRTSAQLSSTSCVSIRTSQHQILVARDCSVELCLSAMNFGGGPPFGNGPPFTNVPPFGYTSAYPGMVPPMTAVPGMPFGQPLPTTYPQGQGPLAGRPAQRGANGLFEAPEPEGPEVHGTSARSHSLNTCIS